MKVAGIRAKNFKSFDNLNYHFNNFTVVIGANASGKSNLVSVFKFVNYVINRGIDDAISLSGGIKYLSNHNVTSHSNIEVGIDLDLASEKGYFGLDDENYLVKPTSIEYDMSIHSTRLDRYLIETERMVITYNIFQKGSGKSNVKDKVPLYQYECTIVNKKNTSDSDVDIKPLSTKTNKAIENELKKPLSIIKRLSADNSESMLYYSRLIMPPTIRNGVIQIYDFDPKILKKPSSGESDVKLDSIGSNLAMSLKKLYMNNRGSHDTLIKYVHTLLPFIDKIDTEENLDNSISYFIRENYSKEKYPSNHISDGTANIIALLYPLVVDSNIATIIEEPEKNVHPALVGKYIELLMDVSKTRQFIITTHSPTIVDLVDLGAILFLKRDESGITRLITPSDSPMVTELLKTELGAGDLFISDMIGE